MKNLSVRMSLCAAACALGFISTSHRSFANTESIDPNVAAEVLINSSGFNLTTNLISFDVRQDPANEVEKRTILEFPLSSLAPDAMISSATLDLSVTFAGQGAIPVHGYAGDGIADLADAIIPADDLIGVSEVITTNSSTVSVDLDTDFIQGLIGSASHLGVLLLGSTNTMETTFGQLGIVPATLHLNLSASGDFNNDGTVDGLDFLSWQRGESPNPFSNSDLVLWEDSYGDSVVGAVGVVPEPASAALLALGMLFCMGRREK